VPERHRIVTLGVSLAAAAFGIAAEVGANAPQGLALALVAPDLQVGYAVGTPARLLDSAGRPLGPLTAGRQETVLRAAAGQPVLRRRAGLLRYRLTPDGRIELNVRIPCASCSLTTRSCSARASPGCSRTRGST
jgi:hypothetical protein